MDDYVLDLLECKVKEINRLEKLLEEKENLIEQYKKEVANNSKSLDIIIADNKKKQAKIDRAIAYIKKNWTTANTLPIEDFALIGEDWRVYMFNILKGL